MSSPNDIFCALEQLRDELNIIVLKDVAHLEKSLDTLKRELAINQKNEVKESAETLRNLSIELEKIESTEFSFLKTFGMEENELVHSNFLSWLLDPSENHGLGSQFIESFLNLVIRKTENKIDLSCIDFCDILVEREISSETSRLDIRLMDIKGLFHCTIENKIFSKEGDDQTNRLYRDFHGICPNELFIFLTLDKNEKASNENFISIAYSELVPIFYALLDVAVGDTKLLMKNYLNTLERLILAERFDGYSERTQLYFRYVKQINEVKAAYDKDRKLLLSALEDGVKERQWWDESTWSLEKTGSDIFIWKPKWCPDDTGVYLWIRPWIEGPACGLSVYGSPTSFSAKFVRILKKQLEAKYVGKKAGEFVTHLTGVNTFFEKTMEFSFTEKDQVEKILKSLDEMVDQFEKLLDDSVEEFSKK